MADPAYIVDGVLTDGEAWVGIATTTLASDTATVTFTSTDDGQVGDWSQYMDLVLVFYASCVNSGTPSALSFQINVNSDTSSSYPYQMLYGTGAAAGAWGSSGGRWNVGDTVGNATGTNYMGAGVMHLFDINSGKYKSGVCQTANDMDGSGSARVTGLTYTKQAAITEMTIGTGSPYLRAGSSFSLFGVLPRMVA